MLTERRNPYIWVTWLSPLLQGSQSCEWAVWLKAHYTYDKLTNDFDFDPWQRRHTELLTETTRELMENDQVVTIEGENSFNLKGSTGITLGGKPDLVTESEDGIFIWDVKTGRPKSDHKAQVLIYMYALPLVFPKYKGKEIHGVLRYPNDYVDILPSELDVEFKGQLFRTIKRVGGDEPPVKVPSSGECGFCDIPVEDCPERHEATIEAKSTEDF